METLRREGKIFFSKHENWIFPIRKFILGDFNSMETLKTEGKNFFSKHENWIYSKFKFSKIYSKRF